MRWLKRDKVESPEKLFLRQKKLGEEISVKLNNAIKSNKKSKMLIVDNPDVYGKYRLMIYKVYNNNNKAIMEILLDLSENNAEFKKLEKNDIFAWIYKDKKMFTFDFIAKINAVKERIATI